MFAFTTKEIDMIARRYLALLFLVSVCGVGCSPSGSPAPAATTPVKAASANETTAEPKSPSASPRKVTLLNVSYDPTREFYVEFNAAFAKHWQAQHGQEVTVDQSHGGSGKQARSVIDGLEADIVTLALAQDIDAIAEKAKLLPPDWQAKLPHNSCPYTSTIVFLVRKGNPKQIKDWDDLVKGDVSVITPNPKTGGGARWNYLAAWGFALKRELGDWGKLKLPDANEEVSSAQAKAREFVTELYKRVPVLDSGARGSTNTFIQREIGDVLLTWENEAFLAMNELGPDKVELVVPSISILAEPPVAVIEKSAEKHGTANVAKAYLDYLYSPVGQQLAAKYHYRPSVPHAPSEEEKKQFVELELFQLEEVFGSWKETQAKHFDDGAIFDQIYQPGKQ
jgi:sulfate/thiosulfate-binding protein